MIFNYTQNKDGTFISTSTKYKVDLKSLQKPRNNVAGINCPEMAEITRLLRTLGELDLSEGRAYNLSFVTSPGEYNIADDT